MSQAANTSLTALARQIERRQITAEELTAGCLQAIDQRRDLNAFTQVFATTAMADARSADRELAAGRHRGPLHGIPISLKDLIDVAGVPTSAASRVREGHRALADAPIVSRLREAGAVIVGKCNLHEFAYGTTSDESAFGPVRNPLDPSRSAGGSSGGSAVSVMTGMAVASIGTDTGGSIRIPAAACGAVGLKPTYGEVSTDGVVPLSRALDHVGPITRTVEDAWLVHAAIGRDREARPAPREPQSLRLAVPRGYLLDVLDDEVRARFEEALGTWRARRRPGGGRLPPECRAGAIGLFADWPLGCHGLPRARRSRRRPSATRPECGCGSNWAAMCSPKTTSAHSGDGRR